MCPLLTETFLRNETVVAAKLEHKGKRKYMQGRTPTESVNMPRIKEPILSRLQVKLQVQGAVIMKTYLHSSTMSVT